MVPFTLDLEFKITKKQKNFLSRIQEIISAKQLTYPLGALLYSYTLQQQTNPFEKEGSAMLKKNYTKTGRRCRVTFKYPNEEQAETAVLAGDFNQWSTEANPMKKLKDGSFSVTITLTAGQSYGYRYVLDNTTWVNDPEADRYVANEFGEENSVVEL